MTAITTSPEPNSDSDDSEAPPSPNFKPTSNTSLKYYRLITRNPNKQSKLRFLENESTMQRSSPKNRDLLLIYLLVTLLIAPFNLLGIIHLLRLIITYIII